MAQGRLIGHVGDTGATHPGISQDCATSPVRATKGLGTGTFGQDAGIGHGRLGFRLAIS
ncbi:hypothetical protein AB0G02_28730 [Actinosynnema sp. NPDC023658]|uniref:hypothetical protein n=1 Tax=Actinosynnema sp. NPDC023658 TaxID=3155465 RepID=UPI0033C69C63